MLLIDCYGVKPTSEYGTSAHHRYEPGVDPHQSFVDCLGSARAGMGTVPPTGFIDNIVELRRIHD